MNNLKHILCINTIHKTSNTISSIFSSGSLDKLWKYLFAWQATQREDTYEETIKDLTVRLKDVSDIKLFLTTYNYKNLNCSNLVFRTLVDDQEKSFS